MVKNLKRKKRLSRSRKRNPTVTKEIISKPVKTKNKLKTIESKTNKTTKPKATRTPKKDEKNQKESIPIENGDIMENNDKNELSCLECGSTKPIIDHKRKEIVCGFCGFVMDYNSDDMGHEWGTFDHEQRDKCTSGDAPITDTINDNGLSTMMDGSNKDIYRENMPARNRAQWYRLRKLQRNISRNGDTESLAFALSKLGLYSSRLGLPRSVRESASTIYINAVENNLIRDRSIEEVVAASLYLACRRCQEPRTLDEIVAVSRVSKKEVGRTFRFLTRELHIILPSISPIDYVPRFSSELNLSDNVQSTAIEIINEAIQNGLTIRYGPTGVAAAALYIAGLLHGEGKPLCDVAVIAGVTEVTIRNRFHEITEHLILD